MERNVAMEAMDFLGYPKRGRIHYLDLPMDMTGRVPQYVACTNHKVRQVFEEWRRNRPPQPWEEGYLHKFM